MITVAMVAVNELGVCRILHKFLAFPAPACGSRGCATHVQS